MTDEAIAELTPVLGSIRRACAAAGRPQASHYRRHRRSPQPDRPVRERRPQPRALSEAERVTVRSVLNSATFVDGGAVVQATATERRVAHGTRLPLVP